MVFGTLGMFPKRLEMGTKELEIRKCTRTIQCTTLLRTAIILRRVLKESDFSERPPVNVGMKKLARNIIIITIKLITIPKAEKGHRQNLCDKNRKRERFV